MQCVILAGGRGTRMEPMTGTLPKSLIPVGGHPFLKYQLDWLVKQGISQVVLCVGYKGNMIRAYAKEGTAWGLPIRYVDEGERLRGTGGALKLALEAGVLESEFFVMYGDSFLPIDFQEVWHYFQKRPEPALMTVLRNEEKWGPSNACFDGDRVTLYDKSKERPKPKDMRYIDYGLSALRRSVVKRESLSSQTDDLAELFHALSVRGDLAAFEVKTRFFEIGSPTGLADFSRYTQRA